MKERMIAFMMGRYGVDDLNKHLLYLVFILIVISMLTGVNALVYINYLILAIILFRMFSRNINKRYAEEQKYEEIISPVTRTFSLMKKRMSDRSHKYYRCPSCHQMVRLPKGKGKIEVTCPKCQTKFEKRT